MRLHRTRTFLRLYRWLPHRLLGRLVRGLATARRPRWAIDRYIARWIAQARIPTDEFMPGPYATVESFFLRRLRPGARPLGDGVLAPADGIVVGAGPIARNTILQIKGIELDLRRLTTGRGPALDLAAYDGGRYLTTFLTPNGYHFVHMPIAATVVDIRWIPGRAFPQNQDALHHIPRIYERNERVTLRCRTPESHEFLLILVGASLIGGIHLVDHPRPLWARPEPVPWARSFARGDELGHFTFGSTVVLLVPPALAGPPPAIGNTIRMGQRLW